MPELTNGLTRAEAIAWPKVSNNEAVHVEPETEIEEMAAAKKEDFLNTLAKHVATSAVVGALMAGGAIWVQSARGEERLANVQRELQMVKDKGELIQVKLDIGDKKIAILEERIRASDEIKRMNDNIERLLKGRK